MSIFRRKKQDAQRLAPCPKCLQTVPADALTWRPSPLFRGLSALPVKFTTA